MKTKHGVRARMGKRVRRRRKGRTRTEGRIRLTSTWHSIVSAASAFDCVLWSVKSERCVLSTQPVFLTFQFLFLFLFLFPPLLCANVLAFHYSLSFSILNFPFFCNCSIIFPARTSHALAFLPPLRSAGPSRASRRQGSGLGLHRRPLVRQRSRGLPLWPARHPQLLHARLRSLPPLVPRYVLC